MYILLQISISLKKKTLKILNYWKKNENFVDLFDYRDSNWRKYSFKKLRTYKYHSNYDN